LNENRRIVTIAAPGALPDALAKALGTPGFDVDNIEAIAGNDGGPSLKGRNEEIVGRLGRRDTAVVLEDAALPAQDCLGLVVRLRREWGFDGMIVLIGNRSARELYEVHRHPAALCRTGIAYLNRPLQLEALVKLLAAGAPTGATPHGSCLALWTWDADPAGRLHDLKNAITALCQQLAAMARRPEKATADRLEELARQSQHAEEELLALWQALDTRNLGKGG